jgi:hypothetical protein
MRWLESLHFHPLALSFPKEARATARGVLEFFREARATSRGDSSATLGSSHLIPPFYLSSQLARSALEPWYLR